MELVIFHLSCISLNYELHSAHDVIVIIILKGYEDPSSYLTRGWSHFT